MIKVERYSEDSVRTYSDAGFKIMQDETGNIYEEAIDPVSMNRTYTETDIPLDEDEDREKIEAIRILDIILEE